MYKEMLLEKNKRLITCSRGSKKTRASDKMAIWLKRAKGWKLLFYLFIFPGRSKPTTSSLMSFHHQRCFHDISILPDKWWIISFVTAQRCSQCCRLDEHFLIQRIHWTLEIPRNTNDDKDDKAEKRDGPRGKPYNTYIECLMRLSSNRRRRQTNCNTSKRQQEELILLLRKNGILPTMRGSVNQRGGLCDSSTSLWWSSAPVTGGGAKKRPAAAA